MALPAQDTVIPVVRNVPTLETVGVVPFGVDSEAWPANPNQATITATGTLPNRPVAAGVSTTTPNYFEFPITAPAAVTLTLPDSGANYVIGDVIRVVSRTTLANPVTVQDAQGPTTLNVMPVTANTLTSTRARYLGPQAGAPSWQAF